MKCLHWGANKSKLHWILSVNTLIFVRLCLNSSRKVAQKVSKLCRQPALSTATVDTSLQLLHPALFLSFTVVFLHVLTAASGALLVSTSMQPYPTSSLPLSYPFVIMRPMKFHFLLLTSSLSFSILPIQVTSLLLILSCRRILSICLSHLLWRKSMFFKSHFVHLPFLATFHKEWFNQILILPDFVWSVILLLPQIFFNLINTPMALTTVLWMSCVPPPSLETVAPWHTNPLPIHFHCIIVSRIYSLIGSLHLHWLSISPSFLLWGLANRFLSKSAVCLTILGQHHLPNQYLQSSNLFRCYTLALSFSLLNQEPAGRVELTN